MLFQRLQIPAPIEVYRLGAQISMQPARTRRARGQAQAQACRKLESVRLQKHRSTKRTKGDGRKKERNGQIAKRRQGERETERDSQSAKAHNR